MVQQARLPHRAVLLAVIALACLVGVVFFPVVDFEFVDYDVTGQVVNNPHIRGLTGENLKYIFTSRCVTSYYPVRTLSFALDYQCWGLKPGGFKLTNVLIHLANVLLVFWLVLRLYGHPAAAVKSPQPRYDLFLAAYSVGIFAVHPVVVEPVAWVAGREELLMTLGALGCFHLYLTSRRLDERGGRPRTAVACRFAAACCCAVACLSNAVAAVIPLLITTWDVLTLARPKFWKIVRATAALWVMSVVTVVIKVLGFRGPVSGGPDLGLDERLMLVLQVYWLNLKSLILPTDLAPSRNKYDPETFTDPNVILGAVTVVLTCVILWWFRRRKLVLFGLLWFCIALSPGSQIVISHVHRADRFMYLPFVGLVLVTAIGLRPFGQFLRRLVPTVAFTGVSLGGLLILGILGAGQVQTWRNSITMWANCLRVDPDNALAHYALGVNLDQRGQHDLAEQHRQQQIRLDSNDPEAMRCAALLAMKGTDAQPPNYPLAVQLARWAGKLNRWEDSLYFHTLAEAHSNLARTLVDQGELRRAIDNYHLALGALPDYQPALIQLAVVLATCNDKELRNPQEAIQLAERAKVSMDKNDPMSWMILAAVYAEAWEFDQAISATETAIQLTESSGQSQLLDELRRRLELYRKRIPPESMR